VQRFHVDPENPLRDVEAFLHAVNGGELPCRSCGVFRFPSDLVTKYRDELAKVLRDPVHHGGVDPCESSVVDRIGSGDTTLHLEVGRLVLLMGFSRDLCRCNTCGDFFLVQRMKKGRPRRDYCSEEHRRELYAFKAPERVRKSRKERAGKVH